MSQIIPSPSDSSFECFRGRLLDPENVARLAKEVSWDVSSLTKRLGLALGEVAQTLRLLAGLEVADGGRVLEVGAGLGLTSAYLSSCGLAVTALEPAGVGFEEHSSLVAAIMRSTDATHDLLTISAEQLDANVHGKYDVIFSNNVLEHIGDLDAAMAAMRHVMASDGVMVHSCPNYSVPFEPHFGVPLLPGRPASTSRVLPSSITGSAVWRSLNFVRAGDVRRIAGALDLRVDFRGGSLAKSVERLGTDAEFRSRHRLLGVVGRVLVTCRVTAGLRHLPASWATPMDFALSDSDDTIGRVRRWQRS
jgi:2-polyprenyl-3-methyl-5-hydroxy-6-metoxy-1,4-benzoquinol methylase